MRKTQLSQLYACSVAMVLLCSAPNYAEGISGLIPSVEMPAVASASREAVLEELKKADVVYLGETHTRDGDREVQLRIIQHLHRHNEKVAIAMEMFQRPYQSAIDAYLRGELSEEQLIEQTEYEQRWGFSWESYAPILRYAREHQLPVLALNTPTEVTRKVAREGLASLTPEERQHIPPVEEIRTDNADYREMVLAVYRQHMQGGHGSSANFENFFLAQVLWDETMAETIARFAIENPDYQVVAIAGQGHILYGYGIPSRVERRLNGQSGSRRFVQRSLLLSAPEEMRSTQDKPMADFVWQPD